jgi:hypothetical protein
MVNALPSRPSVKVTLVLVFRIVFRRSLMYSLAPAKSTRPSPNSAFMRSNSSSVGTTTASGSSPPVASRMASYQAVGLRLR